MEAAVITAVGIDVSKSKSTVAVRRPGGEIVLRPFEVHHTNSDLKKLASTLKKLGGDIRIVMEHTSTYWRPIALTLKEADFFVSVVNAMLIHDFSDNTIRKLKTDRADGHIRGMVDELESLRQAIYLILSTERYAYLIYSWNYGVELVELIGQPKEYALPEIKRCITEALLQDDRITAVDGFEFEAGKKTVHVTFTVHSIFGDLEVETDV